MTVSFMSWIEPERALTLRLAKSKQDGPCGPRREPAKRRLWLGALRIVALAAVALGLSTAARAGMHDAETCRRIKSEHDTLNASGIREIMTKGPDWAKSNLTKERMEQIRRFLALEEDVRFRCPLGKARPELEAAESEAGATTALQPGETAPVAKPPAKAAAKSTRKAKAQPAAPAADQADAQGSGTGNAAASVDKPTTTAKSAPKKKAAAAEAAPASSVQPDAVSGDGAAEAARKRPR